MGSIPECGAEGSGEGSSPLGTPSPNSGLWGLVQHRVTLPVCHGWLVQPCGTRLHKATVAQLQGEGKVDACHLKEAPSEPGRLA